MDLKKHFQCASLEKELFQNREYIFTCKPHENDLFSELDQFNLEKKVKSDYFIFTPSFVCSTEPLLLQPAEHLELNVDILTMHVV